MSEMARKRELRLATSDWLELARSRSGRPRGSCTHRHVLAFSSVGRHPVEGLVSRHPVLVICPNGKMVAAGESR